MTRRRRLPTEGDSLAAKKARAFAREPGKAHPREFVRSIEKARGEFLPSAIRSALRAKAAEKRRAIRKTPVIAARSDSARPGFLGRLRARVSSLLRRTP